MGVTGQILEHLPGAAERWLGVDDPIGSDRLVKQTLECLGIGKSTQLAKEPELSTAKGLLQTGNELAPKDATQDAYREEEVRTPLDPLLAVGGESASRNHAMQVGMMHQVLAPRMQDGEKANLRAEMLGLGGNLQERFGSGLEQEAVDDALVRQRQGAQLGWQREYDVEVGDVEQFRLPRLQPSRAGRGLALGAVAIAARIVGEAAISAGVARLFVSAERSGTAGREIAEGLALLASQDVAILREKRPAGGPHDVADFRSLRYGTVISASASKGLATEVIRPIETAVYRAVVFRLRCPSST